MKSRLFAVLVFFATICLVGGFTMSADAKKGAPATKEVKVETCYVCHEPVKELHTMGKHAKINCVNCHSGLDKHVENPDKANRPVTDTSWQACGKCHKEQMDTYLKQATHRPARDEKSQLTNRSPNPYWDKLMMGHGFTK